MLALKGNAAYFLAVVVLQVTLLKYLGWKNEITTEIYTGNE
jgi:hypothetical protein